MQNLVHVTYDQTGKSKSTNAFGMREMQEKAYEGRTAQYLLLKAPPASGKSRALMFIALDKLQHQGIKKVIVAVVLSVTEILDKNRCQPSTKYLYNTILL